MTDDDDDRIVQLRDAMDVVRHGIEAMPDSRAKARLASELEALRTEMNRWETESSIPEGAPESVRRRVLSLQLVVSKV